MNTVSIALCTYNGEEFLAQQLQSFLKQTRLPDELVVCDDGSTDSTLELLNAFKQEAPFDVRVYINDHKLGVVKNFEKAINLTTGEITFLSDQDDVWSKTKIAKIAERLERYPELAMVFSDVEFIRVDGSSYDPSLFELLGFDGRSQQRFLRGREFGGLLHLNYVLGCALAFRTEYRNVICPIPTQFPSVLHDYWIGLLLSAISSIGVEREPLVKYRQHPYQLTGYRKQLEPDSDLARRSPEELMDGLKRNRERLIELRDFAKRLGSEIQSRYDGACPKVEDEIIRLNSHIAHLEARVLVRENYSVFTKINTISTELFRRRYHSHSNGIRSLVRDVSTLFVPYHASR